MAKKYIPALCAWLLCCFLLVSCTVPASSLPVAGVSSSAVVLPVAGQPAFRMLLSLPNLAGHFNVGLSRAVQDYCDVNNIEISIHSSENDAAAQNLAISNFVGAKGDVILCSPVQVQAVQPFVQSAEEQNVRVIAFGKAIQGASVNVVQDMYACGQLLANEGAMPWLLEKGLTTVGILEYAGANPASAASGMVQALQQQAPSLGIVRMALPAGDNGSQAMQAMLRENPGISVFLAEDDSIALAAMQVLFPQAQSTVGAAVAGTRNPNAYFFAGIGGTQQAIQALAYAGPYRACVNLLPEYNGETLVTVAMQLYAGQAVQGLQQAAYQMEFTRIE